MTQTVARMKRSEVREETFHVARLFPHFADALCGLQDLLRRLRWDDNDIGRAIVALDWAGFQGTSCRGSSGVPEGLEALLSRLAEARSYIAAELRQCQ